MTQIKIFITSFSSNPDKDLEDKINQWLKENNKVHIVEIKWHYQTSYKVMVIYEEKENL